VETLQCCCPCSAPAGELSSPPGHVGARGHPQNGFKGDKSHAPGFSQGKYQQVAPAFPSTPPHPPPLSPHWREAKAVWLLEPQKHLRSLSDGCSRAASPELAPSRSHRRSLLRGDAARCSRGSVSPAPTDPASLRSPSSLGQFLGQELALSPRQRESRPPREGAFAGNFIPARLLGFYFPSCFPAEMRSSRSGPSSGRQTGQPEPFACVKHPFSWGRGRTGQKSQLS